ncbi:MAG: NAD(P)/FAD-dependent oxidoreductase [Polyangiaceae bacterium]
MNATVAIVGAGPIGLYLSLALEHRGIRAAVIDRRREDVSQGAVLGVHPPALDRIEEIGLVDELVAHGVRIHHGLAFGEHELLGEVDFGASARHRFVLSIPQRAVERILGRARVERGAPAIERAEVVAVTAPGRRPTLVLGAASHPRSASFEAVVGCDGKRSTVRAWLGVGFDGAPYPGAYAVADFPDRTTLGTDAAVFSSRRGVVETFPVVGGARRWIARCDDARVPSPAAALVHAMELCIPRWAKERVPVLPSSADASNAKWFRAERYLASHLAVERVALAGDAAHVLSPIGGRGMNLGWMGASSVADALSLGLAGGSVAECLAEDARLRRNIAKAAVERADLDIWVGRPLPTSAAAERGIRGLLTAPLDRVFGRMFGARRLAFGV